MTPLRRVVFLFNLLQDVNILRPLAYLARREFDHRIVFLVSDKFIERDKLKTWQREIERIRGDVDGVTHVYASPLGAFSVLQHGGGVIFTASESNLSAHAETHDVLRAAPPSYLKVTLQHGYECVGFMHNKAHDAAHGRHVTFAADVVCGWSEPAMLTSLCQSERPKLYVTGPSIVLNGLFPGYQAPRANGGLVCENLHSVRLRTRSDINATFIEIFSKFCLRNGGFGIPVNLRPHPGGQYFLKNKVKMPDNVVLQNDPIYNLDLTDFDFAISAPSTVLMDLVLAGVPAAIWQDPDATMDVANYAGLTEISSLEDWLGFARDAAMRPHVLIDRQDRFLKDAQILVDRTEVYRRFATLIANGGALAAPIEVSDKAGPLRILAVPGETSGGSTAWADDAVASGDCELFACDPARDQAAGRSEDWSVGERIEEIEPDVVVCDADCEEAADAVIAAMREADVGLVCRFDGAMLGSAEDGGRRVARSIDALFAAADVVVCVSEDDRGLCRKLGCGAAIVVLSPEGSHVVKPFGRSRTSLGEHGQPAARKLIDALRLSRRVAAERKAFNWPHVAAGAVATRARPLGSI